MPRRRSPPGAIPSDRPEMTDPLLSLAGRHRVKFTPLISRTPLSRKLKRRPLKVFELPKLIPHVFEGMSRLWPNSPAAAAGPKAKRRRTANDIRRLGRFLEVGRMGGSFATLLS